MPLCRRNNGVIGFKRKASPARGSTLPETPSRLKPLAVVAVVLASACEPTGAPSITPTQSASARGVLVVSGSLVLSGAITETVTAQSRGSTRGCRALGPSLQGEVDFGSGASTISVRFEGPPGTTRLPLEGRATPGVYFVEIVAASSGALWRAGQDTPAGVGTLMLSQDGSGAVRGSVDTALAPLRGTSSTLHAKGSWIC